MQKREDRKANDRTNEAYIFVLETLEHFYVSKI